MGTADLDFYPTTAFSGRTPHKTYLWASSLHTLVLKDAQWHLVSDSASQR